MLVVEGVGRTEADRIMAWRSTAQQSTLGLNNMDRETRPVDIILYAKTLLPPEYLNTLHMLQ